MLAAPNCPPQNLLIMVVPPHVLDAPTMSTKSPKKEKEINQKYKETR